jgi:hypothetical protein
MRPRAVSATGRPSRGSASRGSSRRCSRSPRPRGFRADAAAGFAARRGHPGTATSSRSRSRTARCNRWQIEEGPRSREARWPRRFGPYTLQAAIGAAHAEAATAAATDWNRIVATYDLLLEIEPSPVIELNRAAAVAMRDGPAASCTRDRDPQRGESPIPAGACVAGRALPPAWPDPGGARGVPARACADAPGRGASIPGAPARGAPVRLTCRMHACRA